MTVSVPLQERSYDIHIEPDLLSRVLAACADLPLPQEIAILSNETVFPLYGETLRDDLTRGGHRVGTFVMPDGEGENRSITSMALTIFWPSSACAAAD